MKLSSTFLFQRILALLVLFLLSVAYLHAEQTGSELFGKAFEYVIKNERGYSNDPQDRGGETKYGISKRSFPHVNIKKLTLASAKQIYYKEFWQPSEYDRIKNPNLAIKIFDLAVHMGPGWAHRMVARALRASGYRVKEDIYLTPGMVQALNKVDAKVLMAALRSEAAGHYRNIASSKPSQKKFLKGWLNRAYS